MREFRKTETGLFICEECKKSYKKKMGVCSHIAKIHNTQKYYDKWIKEKDEGICKICKGNTKFKTIKKGYAKCCSKKCSNLDLYGVESYYKTNEFKEKRRNKIYERFGVYEPLQFNEFKEKKRKTNLKKYGFEVPKLNQKVNEKYKNTCLERYGVENSMHNIKSFEKMQKTSQTIKKYQNTNIWYQGSYELDFLEKYYDKFSDIQRGPTIKYSFNHKNKVYFSDFYIPSLNLVIEIKSSYYLNNNIEMHKSKEEATIAKDFKYIMILDKNYENFDKLIYS